MNGGFEAGIQSWKGEGRAERLPDGTRVCEIEAARNKMRDIMQEFRMKDLAQVEIVFRARSVGYTGPGIRISIHQVGGGSLIWNRELPSDGSWKNIRIVYSRPNSEERRELIIATLIGTGKVQIDDVEVRAPSQPGEKPDAPSQPVADKPTPATPAPKQMATRPTTPIPAPASIPVPPPAAAAARPAPVLPAGTFGSFEQIVQTVPSEMTAKLANASTTDAAVTEINAFLADKVKGKPGLFRVDVEKIESAPSGANKARIKAPDNDIKIGGPMMKKRFWAYFPDATAPAPDTVKPGMNVTVAGTISRCDFTNAKDGLRLNIDLRDSELKGQ